MKKIILTFVLCLSIAGTSFAQNNVEGMRFLTITALMKYGENLFDRGDYNEAYAVFNHVLSFDQHQHQALQYLKEMGRSPSPSLSSSPVLKPQITQKPEIIQNSQVIRPFVPVHHMIMVGKSYEPSIDILDTKALNEAIEAKKQVIEKLRSQIIEMRANLASQSANK